MGACLCLSTPPHKNSPIPTTNNDINSPSPPIHKTSILSLGSTSATLVNSPKSITTSTTSAASPSNANNSDSNLKTLTTNNTIYNAMINTRERNLTNGSNQSNSTNYSSIEQLYEITTIPNTFDQSNNNISISPKTTNISSNNIPPSECKPLKSPNTNIPTIGLSALSKLQPQIHKLPQKHLPIPCNVSRSKSLNVSTIHNTNIKRISHSASYASQNIMMFISNSTPPETPPHKPLNMSYPITPSPPLTSQHSGQSFSSNNNSRSSFTLTGSMKSGNGIDNFYAINGTHMMGGMEQLTERNESMSNNRIRCLCTEIESNEHNNILDINTIPSQWCIDHDNMLSYMLSLWEIPSALFEIFKLYLHIDGLEILINKPGEYHKRIRSNLLLSLFCPCWYNLFNDIPLRIMQFGYCPGTTQFALKFTKENTNNKINKYESRSRFKTSIEINNNRNELINKLGIEIFDMNIAEFPTMIPSYLESYDPHVILLLFDVCDRSSFDGIIKMRKSLENLYESLSEKTEYDLNINYNSKNNLKRFHESFDAIQKHIKTRSNSVASILSNLSFGINKNKEREKGIKSKSIDIYENNKKSLKKRSRTHSNLNKLNFNKMSKNNIKVNKSDKNEFTIQPLNDNDECISCCYYHNNDGHEQARKISSHMPPILVIGIQADIDKKYRNVSIEEGLQLSKEWDVPYIETSAINGNNVNDVFIECIRTRWLYDTFPNVRLRSRAFLIT